MYIYSYIYIQREGERTIYYRFTSQSMRRMGGIARLSRQGLSGSGDLLPPRGRTQVLEMSVVIIPRRSSIVRICFWDGFTLRWTFQVYSYQACYLNRITMVLITYLISDRIIFYFFYIRIYTHIYTYKYGRDAWTWVIIGGVHFLR